MMDFMNKDILVSKEAEEMFDEESLLTSSEKAKPKRKKENEGLLSSFCKKVNGTLANISITNQVFKTNKMVLNKVVLSYFSGDKICYYVPINNINMDTKLYENMCEIQIDLLVTKSTIKYFVCGLNGVSIDDFIDGMCRVTVYIQQ